MRPLHLLTAQVNNDALHDALHYPRFPLRDIDSMVIPDDLSENDHKLLQSLTLVEGEINELEQGNKPNTQNERKKETSDLQHHNII